MAKSFTVALKGKTVKAYGIGMRVVEGEVTIDFVREAIHAKDIDLKTIHSLFMSDYGIGTALFVNVGTPGTYDNWASVTAYNIATAVAPVAVSGTHTVRFMAIGE